MSRTFLSLAVLAVFAAPALAQTEGGGSAELSTLGGQVRTAIAAARAAQASSRSLYLYTFNIRRSYSGEAPPSLADGLDKAHMTSACVDLRSSGSSGQSVYAGDRLVSSSGGTTDDLLMREPLDDPAVAIIKKTLCLRTDSCAVEVSARAELPIDQLRLVGLTGSNPRIRPGTVVHQAQLPAGEPLPRFSRACMTARYEDSWLNAASEPAARAYLERLGFNLNPAEPTRVLALNLNSGSGTVWSFGSLAEHTTAYHPR